MAWTEPQPGGGFRGRYRHGTDKKTVLQPDGTAFSTKKKAKDAAIEAEVLAKRAAPLAKAASRIPASITWGQWWELLSSKRTFDDTDTARTEASIVKNHLRDHWDKVPLNMIVNKDPVSGTCQVGIQEWVDSPTGLKVRPGMSPGFVRRVYGVFSASINQALKEGGGVLSASPCVGVTLPSTRKTRHSYLTPSKIDKLKLRQDYDDIVTFSNETGFRPGEVCGLHESYCDLDRGFVTAAEVLVSRKRAIRAYPKDKDHRTVPLTKKALEIVRRNLEGRDVGAGCPLPHLDGERCRSVLVFMTLRGKVAIPDTVGRYMHRAAEKAKTERVAMYASRHGFATRLADGGVNVFELADLMGHSDLKLTRGYVQESTQVRDRVLGVLEQD